MALLRELERALLEALAESAEAHRTLERMHDEGLTLQIYLDCRKAGERSADAPLEPARVPAAAAPVSARALARVTGRAGERRTRAPRKSAPVEPAPLFRINTEDLAMLRALGIDPTRKGRSRR